MNGYLMERWQSNGPKRILSLDGGGIRGAITIGILKKVEKILRDRLSRQDLVLADYFDLIVGTSTGAIIASALAIGKSTDFVEKQYKELGKSVFARSFWNRFNLRRIMKAPYSGDRLRSFLEDVFGKDETMASRKFQTGLCIITKRTDTNSTWINLNHPSDKYFDEKKDVPLARFIRASTAAPTYFEPELITLANGKIIPFIDGGISMANNPALTALLVATLPEFPFCWPLGKDSIFLLSVGTGSWRNTAPTYDSVNRWKGYWGARIPIDLMNDASLQNQLLLQAIANCPSPSVIDRRLGTTANAFGLNALSYLRYDVSLEKEALEKLQKNVTFSEKKLKSLRDMSAGKNCEDLIEIGQLAGIEYVVDQHFPDVFNC